MGHYSRRHSGAPKCAAPPVPMVSTHLGVRLGGIGLLLQLLQVEGLPCWAPPLEALIQFSRDVYQPETQSLQALFVLCRIGFSTRYRHKFNSLHVGPPMTTYEKNGLHLLYYL